MKKVAVTILMVVAINFSAISQNDLPDFYVKARSLMWQNINNTKVFQLYVTVSWFSDSTALWYRHYDTSGFEYRSVNLKSGEKSALFDHKVLSEELMKQGSESANPKKLELSGLKVTAKSIEFEFENETYLWDHKKLKKIQKDEPINNPNKSVSPDGQWMVFARNYNLICRHIPSGEEKQLTTAGYKNYEFGSYYGWSDIIIGENAERPTRFNVNWSPDSRYIQTSVVDLRNARKMYLLNNSIDTLFKPQLLSYYRGSPGDTNVVHLIPIIVDINTSKIHYPDIPKIAHENGYRFEWSDESGKGIFSYNKRGFQEASIVEYNVREGQCKILYHEKSKTNVEGFTHYLIKNTPYILIASSSSGWRQLYLLNTVNQVINPITNGRFFVNDVIHIDANSGTVYFTVSGKEEDLNPYFQNLYKTGFEDNRIQRLTAEPGNHEFQLSPCKNFIVDNYGGPDEVNKAVLRRLNDGKVIAQIAQGDVTLLYKEGWKGVESFKVKAADNTTDIYGMIWKPSHFDPKVKYPVIDHSYTGPHTQIVPKTIQRVLSNNNQALAELGFIVIMVDGRGTYGRSKAFSDHSYKRLGYGLDDHIIAIRSLAVKYPWMDTTKVGIFGHSAGGYDATRALLNYPDFYKVGVSSAADHDHRMEKAWWPEMYMGWPVDQHYHDQSNITNAHKLKGKLLLVHGAIDENVNPSATFKLAEALIKADKQFEMMILPSQRHGFQGASQDYFNKLRWNFFVKHLLGKDPVW